MCYRVKCGKCGKPTWQGCGLHIEQALKGVPEADRCQCGKGVGGYLSGFASSLITMAGGGPSGPTEAPKPAEAGEADKANK
jgi:hypothetical protein